jgi:hypothetical protein
MNRQYEQQRHSSDMEPTLETIFSSLSGFDLADGIACAAEDRYGYDELMQWPNTIPEQHRVVHFIWSNTGFAECNGYVEFLMLDCQHIALPASFRAVGLPDLANIVDLMIEPALESNALGDQGALERHFGGWDPFSEWVNQFERTLFRASDRIHEAVAAYCHANQSSFASLLPELRGTRAYKAHFTPDDA